MEAYLATFFASLFLTLLALLHFLKPNVIPSTHMISQYAVGDYGWIMRVAFYCFGLGCLFTALAISPDIQSRAGIYLLLIAATAAIGTGYFDTDPVKPVKDKRSLASALHNLAVFILVPVSPIAAAVVDADLVKNSLFSASDHLLPWLSALVWIGFISYMGAFFYFQISKHQPRSVSPVGYFNRFMVLTYAGWIIGIGWILGSIH